MSEKKGKAERLAMTQKKYVKRFKAYHGHESYIVRKEPAMAISPSKLTPHAYHKRKGCDCRGCTARKKHMKVRHHEAMRTEARKITKSSTD